MDKNIQTYQFTIYTDSGHWLGQIVMTSDGMIAGVTDYGNFSYSWRSFGNDFFEFIMQINEFYFADKLSTGFAYIAQSKKIDAGFRLLASKILPAIKKELSKCEVQKCE